MALAASGQISLADLRSEFGQSGTVSLNGFRKNPAYFSHSWDDNNQSLYGSRTGDPIGTISANSNIPNRGTTSAISLSNFHGANGYNDTVTIYVPFSQAYTQFKQNYVKNGFAMCYFASGYGWYGGGRFGGSFLDPSTTTPLMTVSDVNSTYHTFKGAYFVGSNAYRWSSGANANTPWFLYDATLGYNTGVANTSYLDFAMLAYAGYSSTGANYQTPGYVFKDCGAVTTGQATYPHFQQGNQNTNWGGGGASNTGGTISHPMTGRTLYMTTTAGNKSVAFNAMTGHHAEAYGGHDHNANMPNYYGAHSMYSTTDRRCFVTHRFMHTSTSGSYTFNTNANNTIQIA